MKNLKVKNRGQKSFTLTWTNPGGQYSEYKVTYKKTEGESTWKTETAGTLLRKQIGGLQHGTEYTAVVYTLSGPHTSSGESTKITTSEFCGILYISIRTSFFSQDFLLNTAI